ncbi:MAG: hypothetical protein JXM79_14185 [Sedimentisphaerales bacterium]|nr:hypothetical protein [Sedimentisphaerales bacterium]
MKKIMVIILTSVSVMVPVLASQSAPSEPSDESAVHFSPLHIYIDSGNQSLAAYQFELKATAGQIKIVGVEGGEHKAFKEAPYYDPAALANDRIIIAAFNTGRELPKERTRIATIHLQITGDVEPEYELKLVVAADEHGKDIPAKISYEKGE